MHTDPLHNLGAWPSPAEILAADYPEWHISREVDAGGRHGDWTAEHSTEPDCVLRAADTDGLRTQLETAARKQATGRPGATPRRRKRPDS